MNKIVALLLVLCLLIPQAAFAEEDASLPKFQFSDTQSHWAKKHIAKMGLLGITSGYPDGTFQPEKSIAQQEAVVMLILMMGLKDSVDNDTEVLLPFEVSSFAKPYVVLALDKKLINMQEELAALTNGTLTNSWGSQPASREWITKLIVRAIGKQAEADQASDASTDFVDEDEFGDGYAGYINVAKSLGIVSGFEDGSFKPADTVTRAQMAVFIGNAEKHLASRNTHIHTGTVLSFNGTSLTLQSASGVETLSVAANAAFYEPSSNTAILPSDIETGDYILVIQYENTAYYVEKTDAGSAVQFETISGILESYTTDTQTVTITVDGTASTYSYADNVAITSASGGGLSLSSLIIGSTLDLKRATGAADADIVQIIVKSVPVLKTIEGVVETVFTASNMVEVKEASTGLPSLYEIPNGVSIVSGELTLSGVGDLHAGDEVKVDVKDGIVTAFTVIKSSVVTAEGKVDSIDADGEKIFLLAPDNKLIGYFTAENVEVVISGLVPAGLEDVQKNDEVVLELNAENLVKKIMVKNRKVETKLGLEFLLYEDNSVILKNKDKSFEVFELLEGAELDYNGTAVTISNLNSYFTKGKKVDITYSGERIISMSLATKYTGKVTEINTTAKSIKIESDSLGSVSFAYTTTPSVEVFGKTGATLSDIKLGDSIQILLGETQDKVIQVKLMQTLIAKVSSKLSYKLTVATESVSAGDLYGANTAIITHHSKTSANYNDIAEGGYIQATVAGTTVTAVHIPYIAIGKVTSVNAGQATIAIAEYGKTTRTVSDNTSVKVVKGSTVTTTVSAIAVNDRVAIVEGQSGMRLITVLLPVNKKFISYTESTKTVETTRATLTEKNKFVLHDQAYIHKGTQTVSPATFVRNDAITIYFLDDKIVEIEKL